MLTTSPHPRSRLGNHLLLPAILFFSACGGSSTNSNATDPVIVPAQDLSSDMTRAVTADSSGVTVANASDGQGIRVADEAVNPMSLPSGYTAFQSVSKFASGDPFHLAVVGTATDGTMRVIASHGDESLNASLHVIERLGSSQLPGPDAGSVDYAGDYVGLYVIVPPTTSETSGFVFGDATLTFDFSAGRFSGGITNRQTEDMAARPDVEILTGTINADGSFAGTTAGGSLLFASDPSPGTVSGLIGGPNGEVAGAGFAITYDPVLGVEGSEYGTVVLAAP